MIKIFLLIGLLFAGLFGEAQAQAPTGYYVRTDCTGLATPVTNGAMCLNMTNGKLLKWNGSAWIGTSFEDQYYCADAGANDSYACSLSINPGTYTAGFHAWFKANTANTGQATINFNSQGSAVIKKVQGGVTTDLSDNDIRAGQIVELVYDGANFQMVSQLGNSQQSISGLTAGTIPKAASPTTLTNSGVSEDGVNTNITLPPKIGSCATNCLTLSPANITGSKTLTYPNANDTFVGKATNDVLTNKTIDAEGTGNIISIPITKWLPAAGCNNATAGSVWDLPTSTPAVPACVTGTNTQKGVLDFADTSGGFSAQITEALPADWTTTGGLSIKLYWTTTATSGNAKWSVSTACTAVAASATDDPSFNTADTVTTAAPGTGSRVQTSAIASLTTTGCTTATAMLLHLKVFRDGNDAADTIGATARLIGAELTYRRAM